MNKKEKLKKIVDMVNCMAFEINTFIGKRILELGFEDKYAQRYELTQDMTVKFFIYNTENKTTSCKEFTFEEFAYTCRDSALISEAFSKVTDDLLDACDKPSDKVVFIKDGGIII